MARESSQRTAPAGRKLSVPTMGGGSHGTYAPSDLDRRAVELMTAHGIPQREICSVIVNPATGRAINLATLRKHFPKEVEAGRLRADAEVADSLFRQAVGRARVIVDGEVIEEERLPVTSAAIWWTKARMGWKASGATDEGEDQGERGAAEPVGRVVIFLPENGRDQDLAAGQDRDQERGRQRQPAGASRSSAAAGAAA